MLRLEKAERLTGHIEKVDIGEQVEFDEREC